MGKSFFYKIEYKDKRFYDASHIMTPERRWITLQNNYLYKPQVLSSQLRDLFDEAKKDGLVPKFEIVKESKIEPKIRKERIKQSKAEHRITRLKYEHDFADQIKAKRRENYLIKHEAILQDKKDYYQLHRTHIIQQKKDYRDSHKEQISLNKKLYYLKKKATAVRLRLLALIVMLIISFLTCLLFVGVEHLMTLLAHSLLLPISQSTPFLASTLVLPA
jgi:hypothetical protein